MTIPPLPIPAPDPSGIDASWSYRKYPVGGSSMLAYETGDANRSFQSSPTSNQVDFGDFINSMDEPSFAYFSLIREYASRPLQGCALHYEGLYRALVSQTVDEERLSRISAVEFRNDGSRSKTFYNYEEFKSHLGTEAHSDYSNRRRCLFILEDLPVRHVCLLGSRFRIHPTGFARHFSTEDSSTISNTLSEFPSCDREHTMDGLRYESSDEDENKASIPKRRFTLRYPVTMPHISEKQHPDPNMCPPWFKPNSRFTDQSAYPKFIVERVLATPSRYDQWDSRGGVAELEGQVTYWSQSLEKGGWNAILLVDPCLKDPSHVALINGVSYLNISREIRYPELEDEDKVGIAPNPLQWHPSATFTKYILHDDVLTHFSVANAGPDSSPLAITPFIRGFAISKWTAHLNHAHVCFSHTRSALVSEHTRADLNPGKDANGLVGHTSSWGADWKEWMFERMAYLITNLSLDRMHIEANMRALGIDIEDPNSHGFVGKRETQMWRHLRSCCIDLQEMFQKLASLYTQVVALREAQTSNTQAKSVQWLTGLGTLFVPLSIVAGIMSMGDDFLPGKSKFWVYFVVVVPLLLIMSALLVGISGWQSKIRREGRIWMGNLSRSTTQC
ncbi:hypothetical protein P280DRAFT_111898 [Massarina eburnea CBS 473.64]|uniref:Cora-domain-containing protein n=1 Tax=Massarina eburnea CBS 473.64 TaxID=1395130 RepID=A0A6A6RS41_9PLEO|nr:hypothetical protein P280DRAFT_111898 [Massarina eburnea CBS 473.64]